MKITHKFLYQFVFFLCVAITFLNNYELTFIVWLLAAVMTASSRYSITIIKFIACFSAILLTAFIVYLFGDESTYNFLRDFSYLLKPILGLLIGYQLQKKIPKYFFQTVVYTGVIIALVHIAVVLYTFVQFRSVSVNLLRHYGGYFSDYEIYALILAIFYKKFENNFSQKNIFIISFILAFSSFLYLSRTNFIQFIILFMAMKGYFKITKKAVIFLSVAVIAVFIGYTAIYFSNPSRSGKGIEAFLFKIKNAPIEAFKTRVNSNDWKDFNDNYRSYENIVTIRQVSSQGIFAILFGEGMGSRINLGRQIMTTDGTKVQYIPILHNGFATVFLKSGLFGIFFLVLFLFLLAKHNKSDIPEVKSINLLLVGTSIFLIVSNWVFMGLYLKLDNKSVLIGLLVCCRELLIKQKLVQGND